ncbi:cytochrome d ubiquinol oxidase subunit II [Microtetraspora malaysiensis]|uniref:cytochrome d ubiquinol oxidase subunit II n=1 Tax=Microtetraspora malaysiensis TaxID=161358 RepID=UPI003D91DC1F
MDLVWAVLLGLLFCGYFVVDGFDIGTGLLLRRVGRTEGERRALLTAIGPFFLGNEVWLVAVGGVLAGAFPLVKDRGLGGMYPLVVVGLLVWVVRDVSVWFRSRRASLGWRAGWDRMLVVTSAAFAAFWGLFTGAAFAGLPPAGTTAGAARLAGPYPLLWAVTMVALFAAHGSVFLTARLSGDLMNRAETTASRLLRPAAGLLALAVAAGAVLVLPKRWEVLLPAVLIGGLGAAALWAASAAVRRGRHGRALTLTSLAAASPVAVLLVRLAWDLPDAAADDATLSTLGGFALVTLPLPAAAQAWMWWAFRRRVDAGTVVFF